jgi:hypothetical protein
LVESSRAPPDSGFNYALANPSANRVVQFIRSTESNIERVKITKSNLFFLLVLLEFVFFRCIIYLFSFVLRHGKFNFFKDITWMPFSVIYAVVGPNWFKRNK